MSCTVIREVKDVKGNIETENGVVIQYHVEVAQEGNTVEWDFHWIGIDCHTEVERTDEIESLIWDDVQEQW